VWRRFRERADTVTTFWLRAGAAAGLLTIALQEATEFSLQMPWNAALFCVLAAIAVHRPGARPIRQIGGPSKLGAHEKRRSRRLYFSGEKRAAPTTRNEYTTLPHKPKAKGALRRAFFMGVQATADTPPTPPLLH